MRHYVRILALCLTAVFAVSAVAAGGASAKLPEFGGCEEAPGHEGKYADAGCTQPVKKVYGKYTGGYEWYTGEQFHKGHGLDGYNFEGSIGPTTFETTNGKVIQCPGGELQQLEIQGPKSVGEIRTNFYGCESEGKECESKFATNEGEITDHVEWAEGEGFKGELVYVAGKKTSAPTVGLTLTAFRKTGEVYQHEVDDELETVTANGTLFTVVCEGDIGTVEIGGAGGKKTEKAKGDAVISLVSPVDEMTTQYTQTFSQTLGVQEPAKAETGKEKVLQAYLGNEYKWVGLGVASTFQYESENENRPVEIKAAP